jgi:NIPSNAP
MASSLVYNGPSGRSNPDHILQRRDRMIVVRDLFHVEPEQMKVAKEEFKKHREIAKRLGYRTVRVLTDLTGEYYTLVLESEYSSLAEYEAALHKIFADSEWQQSYSKFRKMIRGGRREIFTLVE